MGASASSLCELGCHFSIHSDQKWNKKASNHWSDAHLCVGTELSSQAASRQVLSPQQSLTSVFGMGTGGPSALKALTSVIKKITENRINEN